jgi:hypothetical protein
MTHPYSQLRPARSPLYREWESGPNAAAIRHWVECIGRLTPAKAGLFRVGVALEVGELPLIEQYGSAGFVLVDTDHRLVVPHAGDEHENAYETASGQSPVWAPSGSTGAAAGRTNAGSSSPEAGSAARERVIRQYAGVGEVMDEDARGLALFFPQFSPALLDLRLGLWYREGWLQPLEWIPRRFLMRMYYPPQPSALPIVTVSPDLRADAPHMWLQVWREVRFRSLCYTFAPDRTIVRGRGEDDDAAEVLRQVVVWLLRYMVWDQFGFWPGVDVGHDPETIEALTHPSDPCPTHNWQPYGACCRPRVLAAIERRRRDRHGIHPSARVA